MGNNSKRQALIALLIGISIAIGMIIGMYYPKEEITENRYIIRSDKLSSLIGFISEEYVDPIDKNAIIESTIPKLLEGLDPHSYYIPAEQFLEANEPLQGNFDGIGVQFNMLNDTLIVIKAIANGPSEKVGILPGDRFITVDGDTLAGVGIASDSIVSRLKGPRGTEVTVGVQRNAVDDLLHFTITRDQIPLYSVDVAYMIDKEIGFIRINKFSSQTFTEFVEAALKLMGQGMKQLVLDLRGNGGGFLTNAVRIADQFLDEGKLIVYTQGNARPREDYRASKGGLCNGVDLIILIDESSASASEILAGAIQDNDRGLVLGRRSFGKGLVQEQKLFRDSSAIRLTIARYYTPTGRCIQKSYENGIDDYYSELSNRYNHGEFMEQDSINFPDSLKYTTPAGRVVYGGGGVMPDIFVPIDTSGVTNYLVKLRNRGLIYRFALEFSDENRDKLTAFATIDEIYNHLKKTKVLSKFISYAEKNDVELIKREYEISREIIEVQLFAYIIRNIHDNEGFYPVIEKIDNTLQTAIQEFKKDKESDKEELEN